MNHHRVAVLGVLSLTIILPSTSYGTEFPPPNSTTFNVSSDSPEGVFVYHVTNPNGLTLYHDMGFSVTSFSHDPLHMVFVTAEGGVYVRSFNYDGSAGFVGDGDDAIYAGHKETSMNTPPTRTINRTQWLDGFRDFETTEGWLILVWENQGGPWEFYTWWPQGTNVTHLANGTVDAYSHKDLQKGTRAGIPPALVAIDDGVTLQTPGGQTFGWVTYWRSDYIGVGELAVTHQGYRHSLDLTQYPTPEDTCFCGEEGRWLFTSHSAVEIEYEAVQFRGDGGLFIVSMHLPPGTLPDNLWHEKIMQHRNYPGDG